MTNPKKDRLISLARSLRVSSTNAESLMWNILRNKNIEGLRFRRQHPIMGYILDFYCPEIKLAVELDGSGHAQNGKLLKDNERTKNLNSIGIMILRFWNNDVLENVENVIDLIILEAMNRRNK